MPDPAKQLQAIYIAGFEIDTFERFPNSLGLRKGNCIALVQAAVDGLKIIGQPGWRMGELLGVLVERAGQRVFQAKSAQLAERKIWGTCSLTPHSPTAGGCGTPPVAML